MTASPPNFRNTKRYDPALRAVCEAIASFAARFAGATSATLINANAVKLNLAGVKRGGTLLVLRFPAAAVTREEQPLQDLIKAAQPAATYHIHAQAETLHGAGPEYTTAQPDTEAGP